MILDSGAREEFETGAVRDIQEGKGRLDLLPLGIVADRFLTTEPKTVLNDINNYIFHGDLQFLWEALDTVNRDGLISMLLDVSIHYELGLKKYGERNWEKGIPLHCYMNSAIRHYLKLIRGDEDEDHLKAFNWNILNAIHTHTYLPDMIDLPFIDKEGN